MRDSCGLMGEVRAVLLVPLDFTFQTLEVESGAPFSGRGPGKGEKATVRVVAAQGSYHIVGWLAVEVSTQAGCVPAVVHSHLLIYDCPVATVFGVIYIIKPVKYFTCKKECIHNYKIYLYSSVCAVLSRHKYRI